MGAVQLQADFSAADRLEMQARTRLVWLSWLSGLSSQSSEPGQILRVQAQPARCAHDSGQPVVVVHVVVDFEENRLVGLGAHVRVQ